MRTVIAIHDDPSPSVNYVSWAPCPCQLRLVELAGATGPVTVTLRNQRTDVGGQVVFYATLTAAGADTLQLLLPLDGSPVPFYVGGRFRRPSLADKDAAIEVTETGTGAILSVTRLMVRVRKDANELTTGERNRFLAALGTLNNGGAGRFNDFREMHTSLSDQESHGWAGFLPWHRAYLLDLERELQNIDPSVTLPYWRFDHPAPNVFDPEFLGISDAAGTVRFAPDNPLLTWRTDQGNGVTRTPHFNTGTAPASSPLGPVRTEEATLNLGLAFSSFRDLEGNPHGWAHISFDGFIDHPHTAPRDPLFFLLHNNVDRLWAKWQWFNRRYDASSTETYRNSPRIGHRVDDTMWPWNQVTTPPRPATAPGGPMARSVAAAAPGLSPRVRDMVDYQGLLDPAGRLGFDYDDVPFEP